MHLIIPQIMLPDEKIHRNEGKEELLCQSVQAPETATVHTS